MLTILVIPFLRNYLQGMRKLDNEKHHYIVVEFARGPDGVVPSRMAGNYFTYEDAMFAANKVERFKTSPQHVVVISRVEGASDEYHTHLNRNQTTY